jgi:hypothetical protein
MAEKGEVIDPNGDRDGRHPGRQHKDGNWNSHHRAHPMTGEIHPSTTATVSFNGQAAATASDSKRGLDPCHRTKGLSMLSHRRG